MSRIKLTEEQIGESLSGLDGWRVKGIHLKKHYDFSNFAESLDFVNRVGEIAEELDHHPDITFGWGYADIVLTTHDTGGLTHNDFDVAKRIELIDH